MLTFSITNIKFNKLCYKLNHHHHNFKFITTNHVVIYRSLTQNQPKTTKKKHVLTNINKNKNKNQRKQEKQKRQQWQQQQQQPNYAKSFFFFSDVKRFKKIRLSETKSENAKVSCIHSLLCTLHI